LISTADISKFNSAPQFSQKAVTSGFNVADVLMEAVRGQAQRLSRDSEVAGWRQEKMQRVLSNAGKTLE
jgi:hypothetical protein